MKARVIAFYLPQFHPIPENDAVWGPGFTEWTNVAKARPQFRGHCQPRIPADLGFYDLRLPETRELQAKLALEAGIEGFCYYHYWFGNGRQLLERPFNEVLASGSPDYPFCLCWANHDWSTKTWKNKAGNHMIARQCYEGEEDYRQHFLSVLPAFRDKRYIAVDGKPLFLIYDPYHFADVRHFMEMWRQMAAENGLPGIHFVAMCSNTTTVRRDAEGNITRQQPDLKSSAAIYDSFLDLGFDAVNSFGKSRGEMLAYGKYLRIARKLLHEKMPFLPALRYDYRKTTPYFFASEDTRDNIYPTILSGWDRTPRAGRHEGIYTHFDPESFATHIAQALDVVSNKPEDRRLLFLKSWNEWGEGNYVEPDEQYGHGFLESLRNELQ